MENVNVSVSPYRWVVLAVFMLNTAMSQIMWMTFAPIARDAAAIYTHGNIDYIDFLAILAMLAWLPFCLPASWCIDTIGLKRGAGIGVVLVGLCGFLRIFAPNYGWLLACMIGCAIAQPFVLNAFTKLAQVVDQAESGDCAINIEYVADDDRLLPGDLIPTITLSLVRQTEAVGPVSADVIDVEPEP